jgi:wyosine [tRNA(Phe)-imidazoG37] synthetase (radical SAM superfamily)
VVSFGQGCEGEPLLQAETIAKGIELIRRKTSRGTINLNSNAGLPDAVERLATTGLDSLRVSMNSARYHYHSRYYRPKGFDLGHVRESIRIMKRAGGFVSLNYFVLPGFTDDPAEAAALDDLIGDCSPDFIQLRNLNMDPDWYLDAIDFMPTGKALGISRWLQRLRGKFPALRFGYFNPPVR